MSPTPSPRERSRWVLVFGCLASGLAHSAACAALSRGASPAQPPATSRVAFRIAAAEPALPVPAAEPAPPAAPKRSEPARSASAKPSARSTATAEPAPRAAEQPDTVDLSGVTLTAEPGQGSFATLAGNGQSFAGPLGPAGPARTPPPAPARAPRASDAPPLVALGDLSSRPVAPELGARLLDFYPEDARRRGIGGTAQVRARVDADGRVREAGVLAESFAGFGAACRRTLLGSHWSAPRDLAGRAVATEIRYTCRFLVQP